jgi:hypothetical protein
LFKKKIEVPQDLFEIRSQPRDSLPACRARLNH